MFVRLFFAQSTHLHVKSYGSEKHAKHLTPIFALFCTSFVKHIQYPLANKDSSKNSTIKIYGIRLGYGCFQKQWYPQIIHFNMVFHYKPSILGYPYFWKHSYVFPVSPIGLFKQQNQLRFGAYIPWPKMPCSHITAMEF